MRQRLRVEKKQKNETKNSILLFVCWIVISLLCLCVLNKNLIFVCIFFYLSFISPGIFCVDSLHVSCDEIKSNEMRFNKQELATLATQPSNKFEKEGILYVTERQDGFFRRSEGNIFYANFLLHLKQQFNLKMVTMKRVWISN